MTKRDDIDPRAPLQLLGVCPEGLVLILTPNNPAHMKALAEFLLVDVNGYMIDRIDQYEAAKREKAAAAYEAAAEKVEAALDSPEGEAARGEAAQLLARWQASGRAN